MINVKFFGVLRMDIGMQTASVNAANIKELYEELAKIVPSISAKEFKNYVTFVNGVNIVDLKLFRTKLNDGDTVSLMSPVSGG